ncbi:cell division protein ZapA [Candidatus Aerophobetes bacterium]|nr:cell division protein ZapA [Candidatus Aerophobetes bacterium]
MKVTIYNREYNLKASTKEDEFSLKQIAAYVDQKFREIASSVPDKNFEKICILTSLNLAAELFNLKNKNMKAKNKLNFLLEQIKSKI